jgi:hypothetical protein
MTAIKDSWTFAGDTHNKLSGDHSDCILQIDIPKNRKFTHVTLLDINVPRSYYLINDLNNTFVLTESTSVTITIPNGNFSSASFLTTIVALLNSNSPGGFIYTMTFPASTGRQTGKYSWGVSNNLGVQPSFTFATLGPWEAFGCDIGTVSFVADALTSPNVIKLRARDSLIYKSDLCTNATDNNLATIYTASTPDFSSIVFLCPDTIAYGKKLQNSNSNVASFTLVDEDSNKINLNGLNIVFTLLFWEKEDIFETMRLFMMGVVEHLQSQPQPQIQAPQQLQVTPGQSQPEQPQQPLFNSPEIIDRPPEGPNFLPPSIDPIIKPDEEKEVGEEPIVVEEQKIV